MATRSPHSPSTVGKPSLSYELRRGSFGNVAGLPPWARQWPLVGVLFFLLP
jgi:hypothetical protein